MTNETEKQKPRRRRWLRGLIFLVALGGLVGVAGLAYLSWNLPSAQSLRDYRPAVSSEVYSEDYVKIGEYYREKRSYVQIQQIPPLLVKAFVAAEDDQFFRHRGVSFTGMFRAMMKNLVAGKVRQGGSTITQQVAKQLVLKSRERSYVRKAKETILAFKMERFLSKEDILEIYLNEVFLGSSSYGVQAASETFFGKDVADLTLAEMAIMAGLMKAPSRDNPHASPERSRSRQLYVLKRLLEEEYVSQTQYEAAVNEEVIVQDRMEINRLYAPYFVEHLRQYVMDRYGDEAVLTGGLQIYTTLNTVQAESGQKAVRHGVRELDRHQGYAGSLENIPEATRLEFIEKLKEENGEEPLEPEQMYRGVVTGVNDKEGLVALNLGGRMGVIPLEDMKWARKPNPDRYWENDLLEKPSQALRPGDVVLVEPLRDPSVREKGLPSEMIPLSLTQEPTVEGALVAMNPKTGAVSAMIGGYSFEKSEFNRAVQARRQPGSAFKPIIYSTALNNGYTAASMIVDSPIVYDDPTTDLTWRPKNFGGKFHGETIFRDCLIKSRNIPTVKIVRDVGIDKVIDMARQFGIESPLARDFSLALGSSSVIPLELVAGYSVFASGGKRIHPVYIKKILDRDGRLLERNLLDDPSLSLTEQVRAMNQTRQAGIKAREVEELGKDPEAELPEEYVLNPQTAYIMTHLLKQVIRSGTGRRASAINRPAAGKTGTTNDNRDAWFVGFTPNLVAGVWFGLDKGDPLGPREEGGRAASPVWLEFMQTALKDVPPTDFSVPDGIMFAQIDPKNGKLATPHTKNPVFEAFREETEPAETTEEAQSRKSPEQFFLQE